MYVNDNKIHGWHDIHDQVQAFHDFVNSIIGGLPPANHDGALSNGTLGDLMLEPVNDKRNTLVHQVVEIGRDTRHFHHHANLSPRKKDSQPFFQPITTKKKTTFSLTDIRWSMRRWQWWQPFLLGACNRTTTWFQCRPSPSNCGKPVRSHLGNPLNSRTTFFLLSIV